MIYTDGSKDGNKVAAAAVVNNDIFSVRLPDEATIFTAEAKAIELAFEYIRISKNTHFTIFSDSLSCLQSLHNMNIEHPLILSILNNYHQVVQKGKKVKFCWVPSHIGIHGNNKADMAAKSALQFEVAKFKIPYTDLNF